MRVRVLPKVYLGIAWRRGMMQARVSPEKFEARRRGMGAERRRRAEWVYGLGAAIAAVLLLVTMV